MYDSLRLLGQLKSSGDAFSRITNRMPEHYSLGLAVRFRDDGSYAGLRRKRNTDPFLILTLSSVNIFFSKRAVA